MTKTFILFLGLSMFVGCSVPEMVDLNEETVSVPPVEDADYCFANVCADLSLEENEDCQLFRDVTKPMGHCFGSACCIKQ